MKGSVWSLVLKQRCKVTWKWPIAPPHFFPLASSAKRSLIFSSRNVHFVLHWISELITYSSFTLRSDWARANQRDHKEWHHYGMVRLEYLKFLRKGRIVWEKKRSFYKSKIIFAHLVPLFTSSLSLLFQELPVQSPPLWWVQTTWGIGKWNTEVQETWRQLAKAQETRRLGTRTEGLVNQLWTKVLRLCLILILRLKRQWLMLQWGKLLITSICLF